jgi:uncharacterized protein (DUF2126 family)
MRRCRTFFDGEPVQRWAAAWVWVTDGEPIRPNSASEAPFQESWEGIYKLNE